MGSAPASLCALNRPSPRPFELSPRWADAWVNYGLQRYRQEAIEDAKVAMRRALAAEPNHAAALCNLGALMRISGESEDAEAAPAREC